jgi:hypothetical protein
MDEDLDHWELEVPGVIGTDSALSVDQDLPDVIPEIIPEPTVEEQDMPKFDSLPLAEDLEYPSLEIETISDHSENLPELGTVKVEDVQKIESLIEDEVSDDLWSADIVEHAPAAATAPTANPIAHEEFVPTKIEELPQVELEVDLDLDLDSGLELESSDDDFDNWKQEPSHSPAPTTTPAPSPAINYEQLKNELIESLKPMLIDLVKEFSKESVERVAWEVIPDLAENLIKLELSKLADSVLKNDE